MIFLMILLMCSVETKYLKFVHLCRDCLTDRLEHTELILLTDNLQILEKTALWQIDNRKTNLTVYKNLMFDQ